MFTVDVCCSGKDEPDHHTDSGLDISDGDLSHSYEIIADMDYGMYAMKTTMLCPLINSKVTTEFLILLSYIFISITVYMISINAIRIPEQNCLAILRYFVIVLLHIGYQSVYVKLNIGYNTVHLFRCMICQVVITFVWSSTITSPKIKNNSYSIICLQQTPVINSFMS